MRMNQDGKVRKKVAKLEILRVTTCGTTGKQLCDKLFHSICQRKRFLFHVQKPDMFQYDHFCFDSEKQVGT